MNNKTKTEIQKTEFSKLKDEHRVLIKWATGCGKSKMTIDLINYSTDPLVSGQLIHRALFVVAERAHIKNWEKEFKKWHLKRNRIATDICCYNSLKKYADYKDYDTIVLDEAHHVFTEKRMAALEALKERLTYNPHIYLLSATLPSGKQDMIEELFGKFTVSSITLKSAIENNILPDPKVYVIGMELDNTKSVQEIKIGNNPNAPIIKWEDRAKYIYRNIPCIIQCTEYQKYNYLTSTMEYWKQRYELSHSEFQRTKWVNTGSVRKRFLGELKTKTVRELIDRLPKKNRFVCFCASVAQANSLDYVNTISSKRPAKSNQVIIDKFNDKKIDHLYAVGMITEGMNLTDIQTGIIVQLDGKERLFLQKAGRVMRSDFPNIYIIYYKNTQDEVYLKNALENIDAKYVQHIDINTLNNIKL